MNKIDKEGTLILKTAEEYLNIFTKEKHVSIKYDDALNAVKQAQLDTINLVVKECAENAKTDRIVISRTHTIGGSYNEFGYIVDKQSIIEISNKLKQQIQNENFL